MIALVELLWNSKNLFVEVTQDFVMGVFWVGCVFLSKAVSIVLVLRWKFYLEIRAVEECCFEELWNALAGRMHNCSWDFGMSLVSFIDWERLLGLRSRAERWRGRFSKLRFGYVNIRHLWCYDGGLVVVIISHGCRSDLHLGFRVWFRKLWNFILGEERVQD